MCLYIYYRERQTKVNYIRWDVAKRYAMEQGIYDEKDVRMAVQLLHHLGTVQYFDNDFLRDNVVINPQWIVDVMACVVSAKDSPIQASVKVIKNSILIISRMLTF